MNERNETAKKEEAHEKTEKKIHELPRLLAERFDDLLPFMDRIRADSRLAAFPVPGTFLSVAYVSGASRISVAALLELWDKGGWSITCPHCGGPALLLTVGGSPLSGSHYWSGYCRACGPVGSRSEIFRDLWVDARDIVRAHPADCSLLDAVAKAHDAVEGCQGAIREEIRCIRKALDKLEKALDRGDDHYVVQHYRAEKVDRLMDDRRRYWKCEDELKRQLQEETEKVRVKLEELPGGAA